MNQYKASMDNLTKLLTIGVIILFVIGFIRVIFNDEFDFSELMMPHSEYIIPFSVIIIFLTTYGFSPKAYAIEDRQLIIYRPFHRKFYATEEMTTVSIVDKKEMPRSIRVFGVGGLFGYFGLFRNSRYGTMIWYATRRDQFVVIERNNGRTIVLTPDDPNSFVSELNEQIQR